MKILLLQDQVYLPSLGGGNKANRLLIEALAAKGHQCMAMVSAFTTRAGPTCREELQSEMAARGLELTAREELFLFRHRGVSVEAMNFSSGDRMREYVVKVIKDFHPDWVLVSDDKRRILLDCAVSVAAERVILLLQTVFHLPFGPYAPHANSEQTALMGKARGIVAISRFLQTYLKDYGNLDSSLVYLPVFGSGPFPVKSDPSRGSITMINPCVEKGLDIFLGLAAEFSHLEFVAVPTWGADDDVIRRLQELPNVTIRPAVDNIDEIFRDTRILLVPSQWPETFGYVIPEAMLRGIPVIASDSGGIPEAKLGVDYIIPIRQAEWRGGRYVSPEQDIRPWSAALEELVSNAEIYRQCSRASRRAALEFEQTARVESFERYLETCATGRDRADRATQSDLVGKNVV
jgi:glycosyltransferase involved in cell wall biosynthesis